jgi:tetratricopeptide (TPR) repeat protein
LGAVQKGFDMMRVAVERSEALPATRSWILTASARLYLLGNDPNAAEAQFQVALGGQETGAFIILDTALARLSRGELALARQDYRAAITAADQLLEYLDQTETRAFAYDALFLKAKGLIGTRQIAAAYAVLKQAEAEAEALGSRRSLWEILWLRSRIEAELGRPQDAAALRVRARSIVQELIDSLYQPELRLSFERLPEIQAALMNEE